MDLTSLRVRNYRCIEDSGWVSVDDLTCLVGKNESGKTAFMEAVQGLNPSFAWDGYDPYRDYPRPAWPEYNDRHGDDPAVVASARFDLAPGEVEAIEESYGQDLLDDQVVTVHRDYDDERHWEFSFDDAALPAALIDAYDLPEGVTSVLADSDSLSELGEEPVGTLESELCGPPRTVLGDEIGAELLAEHLPEFRYVGEYSIMDGRIEVGPLIERREEDDLTPGDQVFLSLLSVAGLALSDLEDVDDWRETTTELESASASVSERAMQYWSQSGDLDIRIQAAREDDEQVLEVRVENRTHNVSVEFEQRSRGFRWFFSTFCQLSELQQGKTDLVLLLDEPGLNLHARAKQEFLRFLKRELAPEHPILYTTHSPFMIDPENLDRTKLVMADPVGGQNVTDDVLDADAYTRFPVRNVFELDLMDTLLVRPETLLVERKADHVYLYVVSELLRDRDERGLDDRWTVVPVTKADNIDTFVSLFDEAKLEVAALLNEPPADRRREGSREIPVTLAGEYADAGDGATIEDVFSPSFYLAVVNRTYATAIGEADGVPDRLTVGDLPAPGEQPIVGQLRSYFQEHDVNGGEFDRDEPALCLQANSEEFADELDGATRRNFTRLFRDLNNTLENFEGVEPRSKSLLETLGLS